jgi:hypothetical protein
MQQRSKVHHHPQFKKTNKRKHVHNGSAHFKCNSRCVSLISALIRMKIVVDRHVWKNLPQIRKKMLAVRNRLPQ